MEPHESRLLPQVMRRTSCMTTMRRKPADLGRLKVWDGLADCGGIGGEAGNVGGRMGWHQVQATSLDAIPSRVR